MQSFANTNSFPIELGLVRPQVKEWAGPKFNLRIDDLFQGCTRFLRYPGTECGLGYRVMRAGAIALLRVRGIWRMPTYDLE